MDRIGVVQIHKLVEKAKGITGLPLALVGYPIPPHRLNCGDTRIASGTPAEIAKALELFMSGHLFGKKQATEQFAADCLAQGLSNEPPHVVVEHNPNVSGRHPFSFYTDTRGLVVVAVDREGGMHEDDEGMVVSEVPQAMGMLMDEGIRAAVIDALAANNVHIDSRHPLPAGGLTPTSGHHSTEV